MAGALLLRDALRFHVTVRWEQSDQIGVNLSVTRHGKLAAGPADGVSMGDSTSEGAGVGR
jgi:hypothetical protein